MPFELYLTIFQIFPQQFMEWTETSRDFCDGRIKLAAWAFSLPSEITVHTVNFIDTR